MARIENIIDTRRGHRLYDEELWDFANQVHGRRLENLTEADLQLRLAHIDRNIQYFEDVGGNRDELPPERGWISPWYWFRLRHWTLAEMSARGTKPGSLLDLRPMPAVRPEFRGIHSGGRKLLVRISRRDWMIEALKAGRLRFAPASTYRVIESDEARTDDEMAKAYRRPGSALTITGPDGQSIVPLGDVVFKTARAVGDAGAEVPYWLQSYSTDLDPRLFVDFRSADGNDAALVIFDVEVFLKRALPHLNRSAPSSEKRLEQIEYFDAYYPSSDKISPLTMKDMRFAYQREWRLILDPGNRENLAGGGVLTLDIGLRPLALQGAVLQHGELALRQRVGLRSVRASGRPAGTKHRRPPAA